MLTALHQRRAGFTLVELMLVVAIIALLGALAAPHFIRARKRSQAARILEDLRIIDQAITTWAADNKKKSGDVCVLAELRQYMKPTDTPLYDNGVDVFGHPYGPFVADVTPVVHPMTFTNLQEVAPPDFWSPYF